MSNTSTTSGVANIVFRIFSNIDRNKVKFVFLKFEETFNNFDHEIEKLGGEVIIIPNPKYIFKFKKQFLKIIKDKQAHIIHNHEVYLNSLLHFITKKVQNRVLIAHSHTTSYSDRLVQSIRNRILCIGIQRTADYHFACSNAAGIHLYGKKIINSDTYYIVNNAINVSDYIYNQETRIKLRHSMQLDNEVIYGNIGRFNKQKNHVFLLEVFNELLKYQNNSRLILIGDGILRKKIQKKVEKMKLTNKVIFLGIRKDVNELLNMLDILIMPSLFEGLPIVGIEAQANGLKCYFSSEITREVDIYNATFISLHEPKETWANIILSENSKHLRQNTKDFVVQKGYSITDESEKLVLKYYNLIERGNLHANK